MNRPSILMYDGACKFCRFVVALVLSADQRQLIVPVSFKTLSDYTGCANLPARSSWHIVSDGHCYSAGEVLVPLLRSIGVPSGIANLLRVNPRIAQWMYDLVANRRHILGRLVPQVSARWADSVIATRKARVSARYRDIRTMVEGLN